ncbi:hypothetical protein [Afipia carboxidovorans]|uniref:hypothetical protein n=1 Tax=Afipia carboxidovorans TaxID=40137 RepID=UPI00308F3A31|nr:hypothetical protein CRBSH125_09260 [Afipia carboxidovorans]
MAARFRTLEDLPLFATEEQLASAIMGTGSLVAWKNVVAKLEADGFPRIDGLHGGRYVPAVKRFYDDLYGVRPDRRPPPEPDRPAEIGKWDRLRQRNGHRG